MLDNFGHIVFDVTHSVQLEAWVDSGGNRFTYPLKRAIFIEVHKDPNVAPSDGPNMLKLDDFEKLASDLKKHGSI